MSAEQVFSGVSLSRHTSILAICTAYESGFGHGLQRDQSANPYGQYSNEWIAYSIGREAGEKKSCPVESDEPLHQSLLGLSRSDQAKLIEHLWKSSDGCERCAVKFRNLRLGKEA